MQKNKISENNQKIKEETNTMAVDFWNEDEILNEEEYCPDLSWWYEVDVEKEMEEMRRLEFKENEWMIKKHIVTNVAYTIKDIINLRQPFFRLEYSSVYSGTTSQRFQPTELQTKLQKGE